MPCPMPDQPANFAALVARLILVAESSGQLRRLPSGELVPPGQPAPGVVQLFVDTPVYVVVEEEDHAAP